MDLTFSRRAALGLMAGAAVLPAEAFALTDSQAATLINNLVGEINRVIASGKSETAMYPDFERIFRKYGDTSTIAAYCFGVDGRRATAAQKTAFKEALIGYVARKYGSRFREFIGGRLEVQSAAPLKNFYEVKTIAYLKGQSPFEVSFHVSDSSGKVLFFNMFIEGVNLLLTERGEIGALLDRNGGDIDRMIAALRTAR